MRSRALWTAMGLIALMAMSVSAEAVMFNYQGRIAVDDVPFNGTGDFKFALVNDAGTVSLWSNDGTSVAGSEPTASVSATVTDGVFSVMVGDPALGMDAIQSLIFNMAGGQNLRVWFDDGVTGFQQLAPDRRVVNPALIGVLGESADVTLYVDATTGDDANTGLDPAAPKATIRAAVDMLPRELRSTVTIDVAPGVYREEVSLVGFTQMDINARLTIEGDASWTPASVGDPTVRISGSDDDVTPVRSRGFWVNQSDGITIRGFLLDDFTYSGLHADQSQVAVQNCKSTDNLNGFIASQSSYLAMSDTAANSNSGVGIGLSVLSTAGLSGCEGDQNGTIGLSLNSRCYAIVSDGGSFSSNGGNGIAVVHNSYAIFRDPHTVDSNGGYGLDVRYQSYVESPSFLTLIGNTGGATNYQHGAAPYN